MSRDRVKAREYQREYYAAHLEQMRDRARRRRERNPSAYRTAMRRYYQRNRERILETARVKHAERKANRDQTEFLTREGRPVSWAQVKATFEPRCPYCDTVMRPLEWHGETYLRCGGCGLETTLIEIRRIQVWEAA